MSIKLDLKGFKYHSSDGKSTTLTHEKHGHSLTLAHNVLSPKNQAVLKALSKIPQQDMTQDQKEESASPYGKVTVKEAKGGQIDAPSTMSGEQPFAKGGDVSDSGSKKGISTQGEDVRAQKERAYPMESTSHMRERAEYHRNAAKDEARGRAEMERTIKPKMQKLAKGGGVSPFDFNPQRDEAQRPYEAGLPCLNPHCKSHGKPHPNCRCYSGGEAFMAEGGYVETFCDSNKPHKPACEYYSNGGEVPDSLKDNASYDQSQQDQSQSQQPDQSAPMTPVNLTINTGSGNQPQVSTQPQPGMEQKPQPAAQPQPKPAPMPQAQAPITAPQPQQPAPLTTAQLPQQQPGTPAEQAYNNFKQDHAKDMAEQNAAFEQDLANGHITPETYHSLFAKKDTIGKIGTMFGLLLGGAGSGLTGGPNPVLAMMDKQIQNDLDAQKTSKQNAQNFLRINQQDVMNKAQAKNLAVDTQTKAYALSQAQMMQSSYHALVNQVNKMPDGPQKQQAQQTLGIMYQKMGDKINNINDQAAGASAFANMMFGDANQQPQTDDQASAEQAFQKRQAGLMALGPTGEERARFEQDRHMPGVSGRASLPIDGADREKVMNHNILDNKVKEITDMANKYNTGAWTKATQQGRNLIATAQQKAAELESYYNKNLDGLGMTPGRLDWLHPQVSGDPTNWMEKLKGSTARLKEIGSSNMMRRNETLKKYGLGSGTQSQGQAQSTPAEQETFEKFDPKSGRTGIYEKGTNRPLRWKD